MLYRIYDSTVASGCCVCRVVRCSLLVRQHLLASQTPELCVAASTCIQATGTILSSIAVALSSGLRLSNV
jgi:hypothetical protein